jgi:2-methylcitrate dehydratase PrpD
VSILFDFCFFVHGSGPIPTEVLISFIVYNICYHTSNSHTWQIRDSPHFITHWVMKTTTFLDSELGFRNALGAAAYFKPEVIIEDLGKIWRMERGSYPCCGAHHPAVDLIVKIVQQNNNINPDGIEEIVVKGIPLLLGLPWSQPWADEASFADCQFCNDYVYAVAAYHGQNPGPHWQMPSSYNDPKIRNLMKRVRVEAYPTTDEFIAAPAKANMHPYHSSDTIVELTANGRKYTAAGKSEQFPGLTVETSDTREPLTDDEMRAKFRNNASYSSLMSNKVEGIIDVVYRLEEVEDVSEMLQMLG